MINQTLGSGGTFATWNAFITAYQNTTLTDNVTITQISNVSHTTTAFLTLLNLAGFTIRFTQATPPLGSPLTGFKTVGDASGPGIFFGGGNPGIRNGAWVMDNLIFEDVAIVFQRGWNNVVVSCSSLLGGAVLATGAQIFGNSDFSGGFIAGAVACTFKLWNCAFLAGNSGGIACNFGGGTVGTLATFVMENVTGLLNGAGQAIATHTSALVTVRNSFSQGGWGGSFTGTGTHNGSTTASAPGTSPQVNVVAANEFVSQSWTSPDFAKLKSAGVLKNTGAAPTLTGNTTGIRGNARPSAGFTSIGADQFAFTPSPGLFLPAFVGGV